MKIAVAGKGGAGKTTVSGTLARAFARAGHKVIALDADANPMLGVSLGVGPEEADRILIVANPTAKSIEVARRAVEVAAGRAPVTVVANRVRDDDDLQAIRSAVNGQDLVAIPEE